VEGRTIHCLQYQIADGERHECAEVNGPYKSTCTVRRAGGTNGEIVEQRCQDNYGHAWDPLKEAAPPLPPASQPPPTP
jgi:hypothetical protein